MSMRYKGGVISATPPTISQTSAPGIWTLEQQFQNAGVWPQQPPTPDEFFEYVSMLLPGNGTNGAQNNTFLDSSSNTFSITRNGNTTQGTFSPYGDNWSNYFDGSSAYLATSSVTLSSDFTIEAWVNQSSASQNSPQLSIGADTANSGTILLYLNTARQLAWYINNSTSSGSTAVSVGTWNHIAMVRSGSTITMYLNGVSQGTFSASTTISGVVNIASTIYSAVRYYGFGYASNVRITNTAVYTGNFTPTAAPLTAVTGTQLLTCQSNRFRDASSNNFAITVNGNTSVQRFSPFAPTTPYSAATVGGSGYFDGSGDYLNTTSTQVIPSGSFTVEAWAYLTTTSTGVTVVAQGTSGNGARFSLGIEGGLWWAQIGSATINAGTPVTNTWTHLAVTFNGSTLTLYVNGTSVGTASTSTNAQNTTLRIGSLGPVDWSTYYWPGYIGQVRISNTVRSISVPTALYTADANTTFLANFTNAGIYDATSKNDLETVGNAQISTTQSKFGGSSMYFDGTGDYLFAPSRAITSMAGDFTVEMWIYRNSGNNFFFTVGDSVGSSGFELYIGNSGANLRLYSGNSVVIDNALTSVNFPTSTWTHVAVVRFSGSVRMYVAGFQASSTWSSTSTFSGNIHVGAEFYNGSVIGTCNGYMQDVRVTNGIARYTSNFTPPTTAYKLR